jgi:hypothetical protein
VSRAIDALARMTDAFFRDPSTGNVILVERPNAQMKALGALLAASRLLRRTHVVNPGDPGEVLLERASMAMLLWWSMHEMRHGSTRYLRTTGAVTAVGAVARTVLADPVHGLATTRRAPSPVAR